MCFGAIDRVPVAHCNSISCIVHPLSQLTLQTRIHTGAPPTRSMTLCSGIYLILFQLIRMWIYAYSRSSWDTFRTVHPLLSLTSPREWAEIVNAYVDGWRNTGAQSAPHSSNPTNRLRQDTFPSVEQTPKRMYICIRLKKMQFLISAQRLRSRGKRWNAHLGRLRHQIWFPVAGSRRPSE